MTGAWIFGCDICQEVCPFNHHGISLTQHAAFAGRAGARIDLRQLLQLRTNREFNSLYNGTALMRAGRKIMLRNAACAAANNRSLECIKALGDCVKSDHAPLVREHARWALLELLPYASGIDADRIKAAVSDNSRTGV